MDNRETGDCFRVAADIVTQFERPIMACAKARAGIDTLDAIDVEPGELRLVHGVVTRPRDEHEHEHAWVEIPRLSLVIEYSNGNQLVTSVGLYYSMGTIKQTHRYTPDDAKIMMIDYAHYGPWPEENNDDD